MLNEQSAHQTCTNPWTSASLEGLLISVLQLQCWLCLYADTHWCSAFENVIQNAMLPFLFLSLIFCVWVFKFWFFFFILITGNLIKEISDILYLSCSGNYYPLIQRSLMLPLLNFFFIHSPCPCCQTLPWSEPILPQNDEPEGFRWGFLFSFPACERAR